MTHEPHPPTEEELEDIFRPEEQERAEAEIRRILKIEDGQRIGLMILLLLE